MESLNKYLLDNNLRLKIDLVCDQYLCKVCRNILCQPKIISNCLHIFCDRCIVNYLNERNHNCPSCDAQVNVQNDLHSDIRLNEEILNIILECAHVHCKERVSIRNMEEHLRQCTNKGRHCILREFGCRSLLRNQEHLKSHIIENIDDHFNSMSMKINEINLSFDILKNENLSNTEKIVSMSKELSRSNQERQNTMRVFIESVDLAKLELRREFDDKIEHVERDRDNLREAMKRDYNEQLELLKLENYNLKIELRDIKKQQLRQKKKMIEAIEFTKSELRRDFIVKLESAEIETNQNGAKKEFTEIGNLKLMKELKLTPQDDSQTREHTIIFTNIIRKPSCVEDFSKIFEISNYYFKMGIFIGDGNFVDICAWSVANENSDELKWPFEFVMKNLVKTRDIGLCSKRFYYDISSRKADYENPVSGSRKILDSRIQVPLRGLPDEISVTLSRE